MPSGRSPCRRLSTNPNSQTRSITWLFPATRCFFASAVGLCGARRWFRPTNSLGRLGAVTQVQCIPQLRPYGNSLIRNCKSSAKPYKIPAKVAAGVEIPWWARLAVDPNLLIIFRLLRQEATSCIEQDRQLLFKTRLDNAIERTRRASFAATMTYHNRYAKAIAGLMLHT